MELETVLRKMSQTQKGKYHMFFTQRLQSKLEQPFKHYKDTRLARVMISFNILEAKYRLSLFLSMAELGHYITYS